MILLFSRFVLTHMRNPKAIVELWGTQLNAQGLLLIEEVEYIDTANPVFNTYINIQRAMLAEQSNLLYIGPKLDEIADWVSLKRRSSEVRMVAVPANKAAAMFHMNLGVCGSTMISSNVPMSVLSRKNLKPVSLPSRQTALMPDQSSGDSATSSWNGLNLNDGYS